MSDEAPALDLGDGLWLSISEIARLKDKSRQAIAKRVEALVEAGKLQTKPGEGGTKLVNLAQFDRAVGEVGDAVKEAAAATRAEIRGRRCQPGVARSPGARGEICRRFEISRS
jgi:DNA-binding IscR family transcriptional regulator